MTRAVPPLARLPEEWVEALRSLGGRAFHAKQVFRWLQARGVLDPLKMTDLPAELRANLVPLEIGRTMQVRDERVAADGTRKSRALPAAGAAFHRRYVRQPRPIWMPTPPLSSRTRTTLTGRPLRWANPSASRNASPPRSVAQWVAYSAPAASQG